MLHKIKWVSIFLFLMNSYLVKSQTINLTKFLLSSQDSSMKIFTLRQNESNQRIIIRNDSIFEYFYSNTKLINLYSCGKVFFSDSNLIILSSDKNLINKKKDLNVYLNKFLHDKAIFLDLNFSMKFNNNYLIELPPYFKRKNLKEGIKLSSIIYPALKL